MTELSLSADVVNELRERHVRFLEERLTDDRAKEDWLSSFDGAYDHLRAQRVRDVVEPARFAERLTALLTTETVHGFAAPIGRDLHARVLTSLRQHDQKLGTYVPDDARSAIDSIVTRPELVPAPLVRRVFEQEATEEMLRDVLYDALREFNDGVNPFFAEWGLPALVKKVVPIGAGTILKSIGTMRAEFDKRLEPEIRKFLLAFSRRAKTKLADFVIAKNSDPAFVNLRKNIVLFFYEQTLADIVAGLTDDAMEEGNRAAESIAWAVVENGKPIAQLKAALETFVDEHGDDTVGQWLDAIGVSERPALRALAELLWPYVRLLLGSPAARAFFERVTSDFYATLETR